MDEKASSAPPSAAPTNFGLPPSPVCFAIETILMEWRKCEEDRRVWLQEKSEFLSRYRSLKEENAKLEKLNKENKKNIKMLEFGIRVERARALEFATKTRRSKQGRRRRALSLPARPGLSGRALDKESMNHFLREIGGETKLPENIRNFIKKDEKPQVSEKSSDHSAAAEPPKKIVEAPKAFSSNTVAVAAGSRRRPFVAHPSDAADAEDLKSSPLPSITNPSSIFDPPEARAETVKTAKPPVSTANSTVPPSYFTTGTLNSSTKSWKPRFALRHHLDNVRHVSFDLSSPETMGSHGYVLGSASEDGTAKLWEVSAPLQANLDKKKSPNVEPIHTFRGHTSAVTSILVKSAANRVFTTGLDSKAIVWDFPPLNNDPYAAFGVCAAFQLFSLPHDNAVWSATTATALSSDLLYSACADGNIYIWDVSSAEAAAAPRALIGADSLPSSVSGIGRIPASICNTATDSSKLLVGYTSGEIGLLDIETAKFVSCFSDPSNNPAASAASVDSSSQRITQITAHSKDSVCLTANLDNSFRLFDFTSNSLVHLFCAHQDAVTSVSCNANGSLIASASHDSSIRIWDYQTRKIIQALEDSQTHRAKYTESIFSLQFHPGINLLASGGADSTVKLFSN